MRSISASASFPWFKEFPVRIELLNRFKTKREQEEIVKKLKLGEIDIVVGTHRLLSKDVEFKNLGLVVIDYLQLISGGPGYGSNRQQEVSDISRTPNTSLSNICSRQVRVSFSHILIVSCVKYAGAI